MLPSKPDSRRVARAQCLAVGWTNAHPISLPSCQGKPQSDMLWQSAKACVAAKEFLCGISLGPWQPPEAYEPQGTSTTI